MSEPFSHGLKDLLPLVTASLSHSPVLIGGVLLHGPTGVGKSGLAEAALNALPSDVYRHHINCTGLFSKRVGAAEAKMVEYFDKLDSGAPSVCVVEDIEGLGLRGQRGVTANRVLALFCRLMDALRVRGRRVVFLASCRDPSLLDPRLCEAGHFDLLLPVAPPDLEERVSILRHLSVRMLSPALDLECSPNVKSAGYEDDGDCSDFHEDARHVHDRNRENSFLLEAVATKTHGFVGADLVRLCREAATHAAHRVMMAHTRLGDAAAETTAGSEAAEAAAEAGPQPPMSSSFSNVVVTLGDFEAALAGPHAQPSSLSTGSSCGGGCGGGGSGSGSSGGSEASHVPQDPRTMAGAKDISQLGGQLQREWKKLQLAVVEPLKGAASAAAYEVRGGGAPPFPDAAAAAAVSPDSERKGETNNPEPSPSTTVVVGAVAAVGATERQEEAGGCQQGQRTEEKDVVDGAEEKEEAATTAALLRALGVGSPRGVLISGPPGTGKTALALSLARACAPFGVRFLSVSCNALVKAEVGSSEKALAEVFAAARRAAPCLVLLDQVEVIAGCRKVPAAGGGDSSSSSSTENTMDRLLSLLLVEVDGVLTGTGGSGGGGDGSFMSMGGLSGGGGGGGAGSRNDGSGDATVVLIATTQDASAVEPALLRPGRLDQHVHLSDHPDRADRADILNRLLTQIPLDLDDRPHYGGEHLPPIYPPSQDSHEGGGLEGAVCEPESRRDTPVETTEKGGSEAFVSWLAEATEGLSAAALESLCQEAAIECLRHDIRSLGVRQQHFKVALGAH